MSAVRVCRECVCKKYVCVLGVFMHRVSVCVYRVSVCALSACSVQ